MPLSDQLEAFSKAQKLRDSGIHLVVVGVGHHVDKTELEVLAGSPENAFMATTYGELLGRTFVSKVTASMCFPMVK